MNFLTDQDQEFVEAFETCRLPNEQFHHRDHLRLALIYLARHGKGEAAGRLSQAIRTYAAYHGKSDKYHETVTQAWLYLVAAAQDRAPGASFQDLLATTPELLDKSLIERYYSPALLHSEAARLRFVPPDRESLPNAA
jgi:hypothetical protein